MNGALFLGPASPIIGPSGERVPMRRASDCNVGFLLANA